MKPSEDRVDALMDALDGEDAGLARQFLARTNELFLLATAHGGIEQIVCEFVAATLEEARAVSRIAQKVFAVASPCAATRGSLSVLVADVPRPDGKFSCVCTFGRGDA